MAIAPVLAGKNTNDLQKVENRPDKKHLDTVATCLQILSFAKNIKLMEGTLTVWERLVADDIRADKFRMEEFIEAVQAGVRTQMYNRIDYADIYEVAVAKAKARKIREEEEQRRKNNERKGDPMPTEVKDILGKINGKSDNSI